MKRAVLFGLALSFLPVAACGEATSGAGPGGSGQPLASAAPPPASAAAAPSGPATSVPSGTAAPAPPLTLRPPGAAAGREERERAALDLLSGRARTADLPLSDVSPGERFEPHLRAAMSFPMDIRIQASSVTGRDEREVQAALEKGKMRLRLCYAPGLRNNPNLQGRVGAHLTGEPGAPPVAKNTGSDVPDSAVVECVLRAVERASVPAPGGPAWQASLRIDLMPG